MRQIEELVDGLNPDASEELRGYVAEIAFTAVRLLDGNTPLGDVKLLNAALRELRYAFRVFAPYRHTRKVTVFGSGRKPEESPECTQADRFARLIADRGFMVITGAGGGIMQAAQAGAGRERSFGLNIRLPFEQMANETIRNDPKLLTFRYFFTRKLLFMKEADAVALFPGGFGTNDEAYECLTLIQTGKAPLIPVVCIDPPGGDFWRHRRRYFEKRLLSEGMISPEDLNLFRVTDDVSQAVEEIERFYRVYHSSRYVREKLVLRLTQAPRPEVLGELERSFRDILVTGGFELRDGPLPEENEPPLAALPRLVFHFNRLSFGRLRELVDVLNGTTAR
jgi:uncharacterized protein (TIGR00730 family)